MTAATPTTTKPAITHPAWCDPDQCSEDRSNGGTLHAVNHRSPLSELTLTTPGAENSTLRIRAWLTQFDDYDEATVTRTAAVPYLDADGDADIPLDQLEAFGRWLIARAMEYRETIEGGAR
ncbi:MAG TPA: hypothetical protein VFE45_04685 [Coriobacteriia bacterium]|nr:hypothetical protein [Coriobacteriia bacterium]